MRRGLPPHAEMQRAVRARDASYDGVFVLAVKTTGIFCRPSCPAKTPRVENVRFYGTPREALTAGFRPCLRCRPLEPPGHSPSWVRTLLAAVEKEPERRWTNADVKALGVDPDRARRWFRTTHGMTFQAYLRQRRLGLALGRLQKGDDVSRAAFDHGFESLSGFRDAFARAFGATPARGRETPLVRVTWLETPLGPMVAGAGDDGVCLLEFGDPERFASQLASLQRHARCAVAPGDHAYLRQLRVQLAEYFDGVRRAFTVPLAPVGTPFQLAAWRALQTIPYGETRSYDAQARAIGRPTAVRAVARANGANRIAIVIPCHRVIGSDGKLRGYGGGLRRKEWLLNHERAPFEAPADQMELITDR